MLFLLCFTNMKSFWNPLQQAKAKLKLILLNKPPEPTNPAFGSILPEKELGNGQNVKMRT